MKAIVFSILFLYGITASVPVQCGEISVLNAKTPEGMNVQMQVCPSEILFGDSVFLELECENTTKEPQTISLPKGKFTCRCGNLSYEYSDPVPVIHENVVPFTACSIRVGPNGSVSLLPTELVTPPLSDWDHPFWQSVREKLESSGEVQLRFDVEFKDTPQSQNLHFSFSIPMRPRPKREMEWIRCWFETTPKEIFEGNLDFQKSSILQKWEYYVRIAGADFYPWGLISGQMPSGAGVPQTLFGWKKLEKSLSPGPLRDHVSMTRHVIELLENPETGVPSFGIPYVSGEYALSDFDEWLETLPNVQKRCFTNALRNEIHAGNQSCFSAMPPIPPQELMEYLNDDYFSELNHIQEIQREVSHRNRMLAARYHLDDETSRKKEKNGFFLFKSLQEKSAKENFPEE